MGGPDEVENDSELDDEEKELERTKKKGIRENLLLGGIVSTFLLGCGIALLFVWARKFLLTGSNNLEAFFTSVMIFVFSGFIIRMTIRNHKDRLKPEEPPRKGRNWWTDTRTRPGTDILRMDGGWPDETYKALGKFSKDIDRLMLGLGLCSPAFFFFGAVGLYYLIKCIQNGFSISCLTFLMVVLAGFGMGATFLWGYLSYRHKFTHKKDEVKISPELAEMIEDGERYDSDRREKWDKKGIKKKCPGCGRGPDEYYNIDDKVFFLPVKKLFDKKKLSPGPECECGSQKEFAMLPYDDDWDIIAVLHRKDIKPCSDCGVSTVIWSEAYRKTPGNDQIANYLQLPEKQLIRFDDVLFLCEECLSKSGLKVGDNVLKYTKKQDKEKKVKEKTFNNKDTNSKKVV
jgi:hypothetical protein